jgi:hypothetical protein
MVDVIIKIKFGTNKYSQVFNKFDPSYGRLEKIMIMVQYIGFPGGY